MELLVEVGFLVSPQRSACQIERANLQAPEIDWFFSLSVLEVIAMHPRYNGSDEVAGEPLPYAWMGIDGGTGGGVLYRFWLPRTHLGEAVVDERHRRQCTHSQHKLSITQRQDAAGRLKRQSCTTLLIWGEGITGGTAHMFGTRGHRGTFETWESVLREKHWTP